MQRLTFSVAGMASSCSADGAAAGDAAVGAGAGDSMLRVVTEALEYTVLPCREGETRTLNSFDTVSSPPHADKRFTAASTPCRR